MLRALITDSKDNKTFNCKIWDDMIPIEYHSSTDMTFKQMLDRLDEIPVLKENRYYRLTENEQYKIMCI